MVALIEKYKNQVFYIISAVFILLNALMIAFEFYYFSFLPLVLLVVLMMLFSLDKLLLLIAFMAPLSFELENMDLNVGMALPTEPIMFGIMLLFFVKVIYDSSFLDRSFLKHPITIAVMFNLLWILITSITSSYPLVSFKYLTGRLWFVTSFFFFGVLLFKKYQNIKIFIWLFTIALAGIIIFNSVKHAQYGFERQVGTWIVRPFFNDHTHYAAVIAMTIPVLLGFIFNKVFPRKLRFLAMLLLLIMVLGILLSYSRAGWVSLIATLGVFLVLRLKIDYRIILAGIAVFIGLFFLFRAEIVMELSKNKQDSSGVYTEHIRSISNISTDASNLERINRWMAAVRMFKEKPFLGWGPGTYQLNYAPFQYSKEKTVISTNAGDMGNAHSEYIGPLSESGVLGMLSFMLVAAFVIYTGIKVYKRSKNPEVRLLVISALLGLITYFTHGVMNNFLDTDKASVIFWGLVSIILALDIYHKDRASETQALR